MAADLTYRAFTKLATQGVVLPDPVHGGVKLNPAWRVFRDSQAQYRSWLEFFGHRLDADRRPTGIERLRAMRHGGASPA